MPRERIFWVVLATLILAGLAASFFGDQPRTVQLTLSPEAPPLQAQTAAARSWREARFEQVAAIPAGEGLPLRNPTLLRLDGKGNLYVLDSGESQVERYSLDGKLAAAYGPADLGNPSDVAVGADGSVWVLDPDRRRITVLSSQGAIERRIALDRIAFRIALESGSGQGGFTAALHRSGKHFFQRFSAAGEPGAAFGIFFPEEVQSSLSADGWMVAAGPDAFVYPFRHAGLLASYTYEGRLRFFRRTIDPLRLPPVHFDTAGGQTIAPEAPQASISASVVGGDLFVLSAGNGQDRVVDVYDVETGSYRWSMHPPEPSARYVVLTADRLFSASRRGVTIWRWGSGEGSKPHQLAQTLRHLGVRGKRPFPEAGYQGCVVTGNEHAAGFLDDWLEGRHVVEGDLAFHHGVAAPLGHEDVTPPVTEAAGAGGAGHHLGEARPEPTALEDAQTPVGHEGLPDL
jgi:hypothetical protein